MAKQITKFQYTRYKDRKEKLEARIPELERNLQEAVALGDLSENAEADSAKAALSSVKLQIAEIDKYLSYDIVDYDQSPTIVVGSFIKVSSPTLEHDLELVLSDSGLLVIDGVLGTDSPLGRMVRGNISGDYTVEDVVYHVEKIRDPDIDAFIDKHPDEEILIKSLFDNVK